MAPRDRRRPTRTATPPADPPARTPRGQYDASHATASTTPTLAPHATGFQRGHAIELAATSRINPKLAASPKPIPASVTPIALPTTSPSTSPVAHQAPSVRRFSRCVEKRRRSARCRARTPRAPALRRQPGRTARHSSARRIAVGRGRCGNFRSSAGGRSGSKPALFRPAPGRRSSARRPARASSSGARVFRHYRARGKPAAAGLSSPKKRAQIPSHAHHSHGKDPPHHTAKTQALLRDPHLAKAGVPGSSLMTTTPGADAISRAVNSRPRTRGTPSVAK